MSNNHPLEVSPPTNGASYSRFIRRVRARYGPLSDKLDPGLITEEILERSFDRLKLSLTKPEDALRVLRQLALERISTLDCDNAVELSQVTQMMTDLAEWSLSKAYKLAYQDLSQTYGIPMTSAGQNTVFWILGMGKLGAGELNVSSDIDLVYLYDHEGETHFPSATADPDPADGLSHYHPNASSKNKCISNQDFYTKLVHQIQRLLDTVTEHGRVFRIDLALRPNGMSGPSVMCLDAFEEYLQIQGREWERFAWLKSRVVAPTALISLPKELSRIIVPFVYRKYLDYQIFDSLRHLHQQIRAQAVKFALGRPERNNDIKLGRGGIREIEFIVQLLQVVRGGQFPELRVRSTLEALGMLEQTRQMTSKSAIQLSEAYIFLRKLEHRIQYLDDQQTHLLPNVPEDLAWVAVSMGFSSTDTFLKALEDHKTAVSEEFSSLLGGSRYESKQSDDPKPSKFGAEQKLSSSIEFREPKVNIQSAFGQRARALIQHPRAQHLRDSAQLKLWTLIHQTDEWVTSDPTLEIGAIRWCDWMESLLRRENYLSLLIERPAIHANLIYILGASRWATHYLNQYPGVIDDLADPQILNQRFDCILFERTLIKRIQALENSEQFDEEAVLNVMRRAHQTEFFLCLARDLSKKITLQEVADDLSALADSVINVTAQVVWRHVKKTHTTTPSFGIVGYGKLGGKELGYGSDLDIVFIYDDSSPNASETYSTFARKIINWLSVKTVSGDLYEIDTALRPNGNSGLLVTQFDAFENYQLQRGANVAWLWEHQAMTRARVVLGNDAFRIRFNQIRTSVLTTQRDLPSLASQVVGMRNKLLQAHSVKPGQFDLKFSPGGMIDVEFDIQFLILAYSYKFSELTQNIGNIGLLEKAQQLGLIDHGLASACVRAYRNYRQAQHLARLDERNLKFENTIFQEEQANVLKLWAFLFST